MSANETPVDPLQRLKDVSADASLTLNTRLALRTLLQAGALRPKMRILSIGSGEGQLEHLLATELEAQIGLVEPNADFGREARWKFQRDGFTLLDDVSARIEEATIRETYDLALALQSWQFVSLERAPLDKVLNALRPGGEFRILLHAANGLIPELQALFALPRPPQHSLTAEAMSEWLKSENIPHELEGAEFPIPLRRFVDEKGRPTDFGRTWFTTLARKKWNEIGAPQLAIAQDLLEERGEVSGDVAFEFGWIRVPRP